MAEVLSEKRTMANAAFNNCFSIEQENVPTFIVAGNRNPKRKGNRPGWSDISGNITAANPFGARVDVRTPVKNFMLTMNGRSVQP